MDKSSQPPLQTAQEALPGAEFLQQYSFANARFAPNEDGASATIGRSAEPSQQVSKTSFALEQFHRLLALRQAR